MGLELEMEWTLKRYNTNMDLGLDLDPELTPHMIKGDTWMGLELEMECTLKRYNTHMDLDPKLTPI